MDIAELIKLEETFPQSVVRKTIDSIYDVIIFHGEKELREIYDSYADLAKMNGSYQERASSVDVERIKHIELMLALFRERKRTYKVKPLRDWLSDGDYQTIERMGFTRFIRMYLEVAIV